MADASLGVAMNAGSMFLGRTPMVSGYRAADLGHREELPAAAYADLVNRHLMFKDMARDRYLASAGVAANWPHGRGMQPAV